jgi:cyclopropane fatty-acyl-phospholipid synthase-like methyltransferase
MTTPHAPARSEPSAWAPAFAEQAAATTPADPAVVDAAMALAPGSALELGCGQGANSLWLAGRGWQVHGVDASAVAVEGLWHAARATGTPVSLEVADLAGWQPSATYDLVVSTFSLPAKGSGRSRMLEAAVAAVAPGGTILLSEFDVSLAREGWMAEKYLVSLDELERYVDGFRVNRSSVRVTRHAHGHEERVLPVATLVATRRTDLRHL